MKTYRTQGMCSRAINYEVQDGIVTACEIVGGCPGNTQGVSKLVIGRKVEDVIAMLKGIQCRNGTSCPDQLARALESETGLKMNAVRISVIRKACYPDLVAKYENPIEHTCDMVEGRQFVSIDAERPEGLCPEAWKTLLPFVKTLAEGGGNFYDGWMRNPKSAMLSCNDRFRPVSFLIETVGEKL